MSAVSPPPYDTYGVKMNELNDDDDGEVQIVHQVSIALLVIACAVLMTVCCTLAIVCRQRHLDKRYVDLEASLKRAVEH